MRDRKGHLEKNSKQRKKGCVKMALDDLWKQQKDKDRSKREKAGESEEHSSGAKYEFWSALSRVKAAASVTSDGDKSGSSIPFLEDSERMHKDVTDKEDFSVSKNTEKMLKYTNKENKKVHADTTSQTVSKQSSYNVKHHVSNSQTTMHKMKYEHIVNKKRKYLLNQGKKVKKQNHESTNKELNTSSKGNEKIPASNKTNKMKIPVQIDREKLKITSEIRLSEKEVNNSKSSYYISETMEADSTVSNDKKDNVHTSNNKNINQVTDVSQHEVCQSVTPEKFQSIPMVPNQNYPSIRERKRKRIKEKFRYCFDKCLTMSEEEEEETIIDLSMYKRRKKDFNETLNDSTNIESCSVLNMTLRQTEVQDTTINLAPYESITSNKVYTETSKIKNVKQVEAVSSITDVVECNKNQTVCDNDMFALENECSVNQKSHTDEIAASALSNNDENIQTNLSNELQIKIVNYSSENHSLNSENNAEEKNVEKPTLRKSFDAERDVLPDSNVNNVNCSDTNMEVLTNYAIQIKTSSEKRSSNNSFDEITCHVSQNSYIKESQLIADSGTVPKVSNSTLDSSTPVKEILEISKNTENHSTTLQDNVSIDATTQKESAMITNINFTESHTKNINDRSVEIQIKVRPYTDTSKCTVRNCDMSLQNINDSTSKVCKQCEDLRQLLQMDINQNHRIQSDGNTISIQEDLEKGANRVTAKEICIRNVTSKENEISSKHSLSNAELRSTEKHSTTVTDIGLKENIGTCNVQNKDNAVIPILSDEEAKLSTDFNTVDNVNPIVSDTSKQDTLLDCNDKNTDNFKQPEAVQPSKIRVLSSAELGSRWCPTPVNNPAPSSVIEPELSCHATAEPIKDNEPCNDSTTNIELNLNTILPEIKLPLSCIYNIMMRIRTIEKKYISNNCENMTTVNQKGLSDDEQFKTNFTVLLQELLNLKTELKIYGIDKVVRYAIAMINKHYIPPNCEPISGEELSRYMTALDILSLKSKAANLNKDSSVLNEQSTNSDNIHIATTKPVPNVSNPNVVPVTLSVTPNLYAPTVSQDHTAYNSLPKQNIYASNVSNQNHEYNIPNLQGVQKSSTNISYVPLMQPTYKNIQVLQENRTPSVSVPYYQCLVQQQPTPLIRMNNVPHANAQLKSNIHFAPRMNMHQRPQEGLIRNQSEFLIEQSTIPQKLPQQTMLHNIPQVSPKAQISQIYISQNAQNAQVPCSTTLPTNSQIYMAQNGQVSCSTTLPTNSQIYMTQNAQNAHVSCSTTLPTNSQTYMTQNAQNAHVSCSTTLPTNSQTYMTQNAQNAHVSCSTPLLTNSQNPLLRTNTILHELAFKIWDQLTYCLEMKVIDCRLIHGAYDKNYCPLKTFHDKWRQAMCYFIYQRMQLIEITKLQSLEAKRMLHYLRDKRRREQLIMKNAESQNQTRLMNLLNKKIKRQKSVSPSSAKSSNVTVQSEVTQHVSQKCVKNVELEKQQQTQAQPNIQLLNNMVASINDVASNESQRSNSVIVRSNFIISDNTTILSHKTDYVENVNVASTSLERTAEKQKNILKTDRVSFSESNNIEAVRITHVQKESLPLEQTVKEVRMQEDSSLLEQTIRKEAVHVQEKNLLIEQTIIEVVNMGKESSLPEQTITEVVDVQEKTSLPEQTVTEVVHMGKESSLPEQTTTEEDINGREHSSLIEQMIKDRNYLQCDSIQNATLMDPHIVDVRSISPTLFNKLDNIYGQNNTQLSSNEDTETTEVKVKIEIPDDKIICLQCSEESTVVCEVCIKAHYCSKKCQVLHWSLEHHKECKPHSLRLSEECDNGAPTTEDTDFDLNYINVP